MNYEKQELDNYNLHIIKTKDFKNTTISIHFRREIDKKEVTKNSVLIYTLIDSSKKYKNSKELEIETENLYGLGISFQNINSGKCRILEFKTKFLNEKYTEPGMFLKSLNFLFELIFNPNVENNKFNEESFELGYRIAKEEIESIKDIPPMYSKIRLLEEMNSENPAFYRKAYLEDLEKINSENLYEYYKSVIDNDIVDIYIAGDITDEMIDSLKQNIKLNKRENINLEHFSIEQKVNEEILSKEKLPIKQAILSMGYVFDDLTKFERRYGLYFLNFILGGSGDSLLFKNVREKESLCYSISSNSSVITSNIIVKAGINSKDYEKTRKLIEKEIENLKNGNFDDSEIDKGKKCFENSTIGIYDSIDSMVNLYSSHEYLNTDLIEEKLENAKKITKQDIISLAHKMKLSKIFLLEGDESNEEN